MKYNIMIDLLAMMKIFFLAGICMTCGSRSCERRDEKTKLGSEKKILD